MRIDCEDCGKAMQVPDDKVPDRIFTLTCPGCQNRLTIDPQAVQQPAAPAPAPTPPTQPQAAQPPHTQPPPAQPPPPQSAAPAMSGAADAARAPSSLDSTGAHAVGGLRSLRSNEMQLLEQLTPLALVVDVDSAPDESIDGQLKLAGMKEIHHLASLAEAVDRAEELEAGMLVIRMSKVSAPPCEPLEPLYRMPSRARRKTFTVLLADNVRTLDGQVAFYLQVNCLINAQETAGMAVALRRALLFHLKQYRHWWDTQEAS